MLEQRIQQHFIDSADLKYQAGPALSKPISQAMQALLACVTSGGKILACGAGVSGLLAQQFAAQFVGRFERERPGLAALALLGGDPSDPAADTPEAADAGHFARQVHALGQAGDVLLAINGTPVSSTEQARAAVAKADKSVALLIQRGEDKIFVPVRLG